MTEVDHTLPGSGAEAKQQVKEYVDAKWTAIEARLTEMKTEIEAAIAAATANCVKVGDAVSLKAANGQLVCAQDGGPTAPNEVFEFQSRESIGPHEQFVVLK